MNYTIRAIQILKEGAKRLERQDAARLKRTVQILKNHFDQWAEEVRTEAIQSVQRISRIGWPPSFVAVAGQSGLEKPFNRLIRWWTRPESEHGLSQIFLIELSQFIGLDEMVADLRRGDFPEVHNEEAVDETNGREPDLMVGTTHAALMLENKVYSPESDGDQYREYLQFFKHWAGNRKKCAVLCSRDKRALPTDWDKAILHADIAAILYRMAELPDMPQWGRVSAIVCAAAFACNPEYEKYHEVKQILKECEEKPLTPQVLYRLSELLPFSDPPLPWSLQK